MAEELSYSMPNCPEYKKYLSYFIKLGSCKEFSFQKEQSVRLAKLNNLLTN